MQTSKYANYESCPLCNKSSGIEHFLILYQTCVKELSHYADLPMSDQFCHVGHDQVKWTDPAYNFQKCLDEKVSSFPLLILIKS